MKIEELKEKDHVIVYFIEHRAVLHTALLHIDDKTTDDIVIHRKIRLLEELDKFDVHFQGKYKQMLKAYSEVDNRLKPLYKKAYPHGGVRKGVGRPRGRNTIYTERLDKMLSVGEKELLLKVLDVSRSEPKLIEYLQDQAKRYRERHAVIDKVIEEKQRNNK